MGSIPSILVIVNHHLLKSTKAPSYARQFAKRTAVKRAKAVRSSSGLQTKAKLPLVQVRKQLVNSRGLTAARRWHTPHRKKRRTPKQVFLATYSLRRQPRFYWVKGRLSMIRLSRLKTFRKPKRYLMSFKKLPKSTTRYKILLRLSVGKRRGFLVRKNISTGAHLRLTKSARRHPFFTSTPGLYTTRKQKYSRAKHQPWPRRSMLNTKLSYLRFRFQSTRTPVSVILNAAPARHQISSQ